MEVMLLAPRPGGDPPVTFLLLFVPLLFLALSWLSNKLMGIYGMYQDWPADPNDPIEQNLGWQQIEFGAFRGHSPMSIKFGRRCLHLKQPFPFQPAFWKGPASIPWNEVRLEKEPKVGWLAFLSATEFRLGQGGRIIRLRGKAARMLMARVLEARGPQAQGTEPPVLRPPVVGPGAIRPK
jgi:hypothetical protein